MTENITAVTATIRYDDYERNYEQSSRQFRQLKEKREKGTLLFRHVKAPRDARGQSFLYHVGIRADGELINLNGFPEEIVREAVAKAVAEKKAERSASAMKAAAKRKHRHELEVDRIAREIAQGKVYGPREWCVCCEKELTDQQSIDRGIGSLCWQRIKRCIEHVRDTPPTEEEKAYAAERLKLEQIVFEANLSLDAAYWSARREREWGTYDRDNLRFRIREIIDAFKSNGATLYVLSASWDPVLAERKAATITTTIAMAPTAGTT